ncbi:MAG: tRNA 2-thiouridine(34) synthase MnmA, partial [Spirochaetales bacterium]|nr:tRNA 2-thiouridine(34) synthase MnmA [Spirochaetales bacterium]
MRVLVGMSGGIDSSVAAYLLKQQGHEVLGVTMSLWKEGRVFHGDFYKDACFSPNKEKEITETREICGKLGIEHTVLDISDLYESTVLRNFREEYLSGRTPNPCIWCNQKIKFGAMVEYARQAGLKFDKFATGHYARIEEKNGRFCLKRGIDPIKDQSYFLYRLSQRQLGSTLFPLGEMTKKEVREIDVKLGFHPQGHPESQDFYSGSYSDLLGVEPKSGDIVDTDGKVLG